MVKMAEGSALEAAVEMAKILCTKEKSCASADYARNVAEFIETFVDLMSSEEPAQ